MRASSWKERADALFKCVLKFKAEPLYKRALAIPEKLFEKDTIASLGSLGDLRWCS